MNTLFRNTLLSAALLTAATSMANLDAELIMPGGKSWKGSVTERDGDWISFAPGGSSRPIRVGASTIKELKFTVSINQEKLNEMNRNREYERLIGSLNRLLKPFAEYEDVPTNLTIYHVLLMDLYYKVGNFDAALELAKKIEKDDRDPEIQDKSRVYIALSLIDSGRLEEAEKLLTEYGWDEGLDGDAAPEKLYISAKLLALKKDFPGAMEMVAKIIAFNSHDPEWMQPAELLCAEIYTELGAQNPIMYDSAEEVIRQISLLYSNSNEDDKAQKLKIRIEELRAEQELAEPESEDA